MKTRKNQEKAIKKKAEEDRVAMMNPEEYAIYTASVEEAAEHERQKAKALKLLTKGKKIGKKKGRKGGRGGGRGKKKNK